MDSRLNEIRFLLKHSSIYGVGNLLSKAVGFLLLPLYTRYLSPVDYGILELIEAMTSMIGLVASIGIGTAMSRFYFDFEDDRSRGAVVSTTFFIATISSLVFIMPLIPITSILSELIFDSRRYSSFFVVALAGLGLGIVIDVGMMHLRILQRSDIYVAISLATLVLNVGLNIYFIVFQQSGPIGILYSVLITRSIIGIPLVLATLHYTGIRFRWRLAVDLVRFSAPLVPADVANTIVGYSDRFFINHFISTGAAGIYGIAQKLGAILHLLVTSPFITTFLPRRFEIARDEEAPAIFASIFDAYFLIMLLLSTGLAVYAREVVMILTAAEFHPAAFYVPVIVLTALVMGVKYHVQFGVFFAKRTVHSMQIEIATMLIHLAGNAVFVPSFGVWGALLAALLAVSSNVTMFYFVARRFYEIPFNFRRTFSALGIGAIAALAAYTVNQGLLVSILLKSVIYALFLGALVYSGIFRLDRILSVLSRQRLRPDV